MKKKKYLYVNPRGFANEFSVYSVTPDMMSEAERIISRYNGDPNGEARFITRKEAEAMVAHERRKARTQERANLNLTPKPCRRHSDYRSG